MVFGPLDTATRELTLQLLDDSVRESTEEFRVQITLDPLNSARVSVGQDTTSIQIEDDDSTYVTNLLYVLATEKKPSHFGSKQVANVTISNVLRLEILRQIN